MSKITEFHSKLPGADVYHNNSRCTIGCNIEEHNKVTGTGGCSLCEECQKLNKF